jgi:hypothetical protein
VYIRRNPNLVFILGFISNSLSEDVGEPRVKKKCLDHDDGAAPELRAPDGGSRPAPAWFTRAIEAPFASEFHGRQRRAHPQPAMVGADAHTRSAARKKPHGILFVHGTGPERTRTGLRTSRRCSWTAGPRWWPLACRRCRAMVRAVRETGTMKPVGRMTSSGSCNQHGSWTPIETRHRCGWATRSAAIGAIRVAQRIGKQLGGIVCCDSGIAHPLYGLEGDAEGERRKQMHQPARPVSGRWVMRWGGVGARWSGGWGRGGVGWPRVAQFQAKTNKSGILAPESE